MPRTVAVLVAAALALALAVLVPDAEPAPSSSAGVVVDHAATVLDQRDPDVPDLPFADNPDPTKCGIPVAWRGQDSRAWLTGVWEGELVQPDVLLYDGHLRLGIKGSAPHGAEVEIVLYQSNPVVDYYMVEVVGADRVRGWVPAPFLSMDRVSA